MPRKGAKKSFLLTPIGVLRTPFKGLKECPFQGPKEGSLGEIILKKRFLPGLKDLKGVSHLFLLTFFDQANRKRLQTVTPYGPELHGVFATRSPHRPNPIGLSVVELVKIEGQRIFVRGVDALDGTPVIDLKPYNPEIDAYPQAVAGWYEKSKKHSKHLSKPRGPKGGILPASANIPSEKPKK
jgi:tRNA-Thr(GGU) m(6)t(6)A37 methyltransferase TsaA